MMRVGYLTAEQFAEIIAPSINAVVGESFQPLDTTLTALAGYGTNGFLVQSAADTFVGRSIAAGTGIDVANGDGVAGNPTVTLEDTAVTPGSYTSADITVDQQGRITAAASGSGGGGATLIDSYTANNTASTWSVVIPSGYRQIVVEIQVISAVVGTVQNIKVHLNADSAAGNYYGQRAGASNTVASNAQFIAANWILGIPGSTAVAPVGIHAITFYDPDNTSVRKVATSIGGWNVGTASGNFTQASYFLAWNSTAAITGITFTENAGNNFLSGTIRVYGIA